MFKSFCVYVGLTMFLFSVVPQVYAAVTINEFLPNPSSANDDDEWIELYNSDPAPRALDGWVLDDIDGGTSPHMIASGTAIPASGYLVFDKTLTQIALNNNGDSVRLLDNNGTVVDVYTYSEANDNTSYGRTIDGGSVWSACLTNTKGSQNNCPLPTITQTPTNTSQPTQIPSKTPTPQVVSLAPSPTAKPTVISATVKITSPTPSGSSTVAILEVSHTPQVRGGQVLAVASSSAAKSANTKTAVIALLFVGTGFGLLSGVFVWQKKDVWKNLKKHQAENT